MTEEPEIDLLSWIDEAMRHKESTSVIRSVSILEDWLEAALKARMRELPPRLDDRLFRGYGPLHTFSAKIDVAYAFELFEAGTHKDMHALREIRNAFAHAMEVVHFKSEHLAPLFQKLTGWTKDVDAFDLFMERVRACINALKPTLETKALVEAIQKHSVEQPSSPEISE